VVALEALRAPGQIDHVLRALDVHALRDGVGHRQVVDRREVVDLGRVGDEPLVRGVVDSQERVGDVARLDGDAISSRQGRRHLARALGHARLDQRDNARIGRVREQPPDEPCADEARKAGDEERRHDRRRNLLVSSATVSVPNTLVSDRVFATLLEALLSGRYAPGEKLPTQRRLAADLGVTMSSVREALKRLEQMGLVDVRHGSAMRVRDWRRHGGLDVLTHLLFRGGGLDAGVLGAILEARALMLRELAGLAAERRSDAQPSRSRSSPSASQRPSIRTTPRAWTSRSSRRSRRPRATSCSS